MSGPGSQPKTSSVPIVRLSTNQTPQNHIFLRTPAGAPIKVINRTIQSNSQIKQQPIVSIQNKPQTSSSVINSRPKPEASSSAQKSGNVLREMCVRVPNRKDRKFSVLRFHEKDKVDFSANKSANPVEVFMQRENNLKHFKNANNIPDGPTKGAGSEFGKEARQEARMKKYGINKRQYKPDDQPWLMTVGKGKTAKRYRGAREGTVSDNVDYYLFCQTKDGNFDAYPIQDWYKMNPEVNYRFLKEDEAEAEYSKLNKTLNLFNVMVQRKLGNEDEKNEQDKDSPTTSNEKKGKKNNRRSFKLTDLDDLDEKADAEDEADDEKDEVDPSKKEEEKNSKEKKKRKAKQLALALKRHGTKRKRRKRHHDPFDSSEDDEMDYLEEAQDESDPDDHMGDEVDYMTNSSSDEEKMSEEEREKLYEVTGVDEEAGLKALLTDLSEDEEENEKEEDNQSDKPDDNLDSDGNESGDNRNSGKSKSKAGKKANNNSSDDDSSDKGTSSSESSSEASDSSDFEGKNPPDAKIAKKSDEDTTQANKLKNKILNCNLASELPTSSPSVKVDPELMAAVAKYLKRKPITLTELMKKIKMKKLLLKNQSYDVMLAEVLKQLRPIKDMINGQNVLYLK